MSVTEADVRAAATAVAGASMDRFFDRYIHSTDELPLPALWRRAGLTVRALPPWSPAGGDRDPVRRARARSWAGVQLQGGGGDRALIRNVLPRSPAWAAGLTFGDEIVAVAGDRVGAATLARRIGDHPPGTALTVSYFRRDRLHETRLVLGTSPERKLVIQPSPSAPARAQAILRGWLGLGRSNRRR
jgi:predicted metalloprotease with PDZ domain